MEVLRMMEGVKSDVECFFLLDGLMRNKRVEYIFATFTYAPITLGKVPSPRSYGLNSKVDRTL